MCQTKSGSAVGARHHCSTQMRLELVFLSVWRTVSWEIVCHDLQAHEFIGQQAQAPVVGPVRRLGTSERDELRLLRPVERAFVDAVRALALQRRRQPLASRTAGAPAARCWD